MIAESDCVTLGKLQDDMLSRIRRKNSINSQSAFCTQSAVCSLYLISILYPVCSLHFVLTGLVMLFFVRASLKSGPKYWSSKKNSSETILAAMIDHDMWTVC